MELGAWCVVLRTLVLTGSLTPGTIAVLPHRFWSVQDFRGRCRHSDMSRGCR
jgi:hypothetical protein